MKRLLIATDGSTGGDAAVEQGVSLAAATGAQVTFVFVRKPPLPIFGNRGYECDLGASLARARHVIERATASAAEIGLEAECEVLEGDAAEQIVTLARRREVDLIVVGSRALGWITGTLLGSVSQAVLDAADRPVLVVVRREAKRRVAA
jgi:nucleotide-binding universal stress UspA family protein